MRKKIKRVKYNREKMIALFKEAGFSDDDIKAHYKKKEQDKSKKKVKIEKPKPRIFYGLNTNSM